MEVQVKCKRPGCGKNFSENNNNGDSCKFHSGKPIFHDIKKGWECCGKIVYDWTEFEKIEGCCVGPHSTRAETVEFWKSNTVTNAATGLQKE